MAFTKLKEGLTTAPILYPCIWEEQFELMYDPPDCISRVVLGQPFDEKLHVIYCVTHNFNEVQVDHTVIANEFLMVVFGFKKFRLYLIGSCMVIFTNYVTLKHLFKKNDAKPRLIGKIMIL